MEPSTSSTVSIRIPDEFYEDEDPFDFKNHNVVSRLKRKSTKEEEEKETKKIKKFSVSFIYLFIFTSYIYI